MGVPVVSSERVSVCRANEEVVGDYCSRTTTATLSRQTRNWQGNKGNANDVILPLPKNYHSLPASVVLLDNGAVADESKVPENDDEG